ncbi:MAG: pyridoxal-dependent decarboxylase [Cyanobacteria bacterium P01_E01_bin.42]
MLNEQDIDRCLQMLNGIYELNESERLAKIQEFVRSSITLTPDIYSPKNLKYLFSYPDPIGVFADLLSHYINSNIHTEECSPVFTHCEVEIIETLLPLVGYPEGDGIFYPGGTLSNLASVVLATQRTNCDRQQWAILISDHSHYSIGKAAKICGIPTILNVKTTTTGVIDLEHLRELVKYIKNNNLNLIYFGCVLGSTILGTFDPVEQIQKIFQEFSVSPWIHFDAAWGGGVYFSQEGEYYRKLSAFSDSLVLDFHKFLLAPLLCSVLLVKNKSMLVDDTIVSDPNSPFNLYTNQPSGKYSLSIKSLQCSREAYAFKLWLMFKYHGIDRFKNLISKNLDNQEQFRQKLSDRVLFVVEPTYFNLCFWFIPPEMEVKETITDYTQIQLEQIQRLNLVISQRIQEESFMKTRHASFNNLPPFIRLIVHHENLTREIIAEIVTYLYNTYESSACEI